MQRKADYYGKINLRIVFTEGVESPSSMETANEVINRSDNNTQLIQPLQEVLNML